VSYSRIYADQNGDTHFEELEPKFAPIEITPGAPLIGMSAPVDAARYVMVRFPPDFDNDLHQTPRRQLFVVLSGEFGGETSDGTHLSMKAGDVLLMEDTDGKGHTARVLSETEVLGMMIHLE
jgi:hypothetical protein